MDRRSLLGLCLLGTACVADVREESADEVELGAQQSALWNASSPLRSAFPGRCLAASTTQSGQQLTIQDCGTSGQNFGLQPNGEIRISGNLCVDVQGNGSADRTRIQTYSCNGSAAQKFELTTTGAIMHKSSGKCLDVQWGNSDAGTPIWLFQCNGTKAQIWQFGHYNQIMYNFSGHCLDVSGGNEADGTPIQLWSCNYTAAQRWIFDSFGKIRGMNKCIGTTGTSNGSRLELQTCGATANQTWSVDVAQKRIRGPGNRCVQLVGNAGQGTRLELRNCGNADEQKFHSYLIESNTQRPYYIGKGNGWVSYDAENAYFLTSAGEICSPSSGDAAVRRVNLITGVETIWSKGCNSPTESKSDNTRLYYIDWALDQLRSITLSSGSDNLVAPLSSAIIRRGIEVDATNVYYPDADGIRASNKGTLVATLLASAASPDLVASDDTTLFYTTGGLTRSLWRVAKTGGAPTLLRSNMNSPKYFATTGGFLYWTEPSSRQIQRMPVGGGTPTVFATTPGPDHVLGITATANAIFWVGGSTGHVNDPSAVWRAPTSDGSDVEIALQGRLDVHGVALPLPLGFFWVDSVGLWYYAQVI